MPRAALEGGAARAHVQPQPKFDEHGLGERHCFGAAAPQRRACRVFAIFQRLQTLARLKDGLSVIGRAAGTYIRLITR